MNNTDEEHIFRLNKKIKELLALYEKTLSSNIELEKQNIQLTDELKKLKTINSETSRLYLQNKYDAERLQSDRGNTDRAHQMLRNKLNDSVKRCREQNEEIIRLKKIQSQRAVVVPITKPTSAIRPTTISSTSDFNYRNETNMKIKKLEEEIRELEEELQESYELIDEFEFEVEQIDYLEGENQRLQDELNKYKLNELNERKRQHFAADPVEEDQEDVEYDVINYHIDESNYGDHLNTVTSSSSSSWQTTTNNENLALNNTSSSNVGIQFVTTDGTILAAEDEESNSTRRNLLQKKLDIMHEKQQNRFSATTFERISIRRSKKKTTNTAAAAAAAGGVTTTAASITNVTAQC